jgi:hypothetical protein
MAPERDTMVSPEATEPGARPAPRRPYRRPEITFHEPLEVHATVCTPGKADVVSCPGGPIAS